MSETIRKARRVSIVARLMGCDRSTVYRMLEDGRLEAYRIDRFWYVFLDTVEKYQKKHDFVAGDIYEGKKG